MEVKSFLATKTLWGLVLTTLGHLEVGQLAIDTFGWTPDSAVAAVETVATWIGGLLVVYGRLKADKPLALTGSK